MREIARRAGVSATTVSHVLNETPGTQVAQATREKVLAVADDMGYQASLLTRSIKSPLRHLGIAVASEQLLASANYASEEIFIAAQAEALAHDYCPVMQPLPSAPGQTDTSAAAERMIEFHRTRLVDGFIIDKVSVLNKAILQLQKHHVPIVTVNGSMVCDPASGKKVPAVVIDNTLGGQFATEHLIDLGHRRIGLITLPYAIYPKGFRPWHVAEIIRGYRQALDSAGITADRDLVVDGNPQDRAETYQVVETIMSTSQAPTALFVGDDSLAVMVMQKLKLMGVRIPEDVSVVGFGDWSLPVRLSEPELTTISTPRQLNGQLAARMLIDLLEGREVMQPQQMLSPELIVRQSSGVVSDRGRL